MQSITQMFLSEALLVKFLQIIIHLSLIFCWGSSGHHVRRTKRIVNGIRVPQGEAHFVTSLQILKNSQFSHFCTGTFLGNGFVLTASHCLKFM